MMYIVLYGMQLNDLFLCLTSVLSQNTGIPIGGPMSAQLPSLTLFYRELVQPVPWGLLHTMRVRSRDNFWFLMKRLRGVNLKATAWDQKFSPAGKSPFNRWEPWSGFRVPALRPLSPHSIALPDFSWPSRKN